MIYIGKGSEECGWHLFFNFFHLMVFDLNILHSGCRWRTHFFERLCSNKTMLTINGGFPGPTIHVRKGNRAYVNVHNEASYGVTIHWWWLSLSLSLSTLYRPSNQFGERKKKKKLYFKQCIWTFFFFFW